MDAKHVRTLLFGYFWLRIMPYPCDFYALNETLSRNEMRDDAQKQTIEIEIEMEMEMEMKKNAMKSKVR